MQLIVQFTALNLRQKKELEIKDVLPDINRTHAAERAEKFHFCPW